MVFFEMNLPLTHLSRPRSFMIAKGVIHLRAAAHIVGGTSAMSVIDTDEPLGSDEYSEIDDGEDDENIDDADDADDADLDDHGMGFDEDDFDDLGPYVDDLEEEDEDEELDPETGVIESETVH